MLVPVFALGAYADEVMADSFPVTEGVTGWVVTNRRTRNVERADIDPLAAVVEGTENEPESLVSVPLLVGDRVVAALNVYRIGARQGVQRGGGRHGRALRDDGRARLRLRAPARHAARAGAHRRAHRPAQPPRLPRDAARGARRRDPRPAAAQRGRARPRPLQVDQRRLRPRRGRQGPQGGRRPAARGRARRRHRRPPRRRGVRADPARASTATARPRPPSARARRSPTSRSPARR